MPSVRPTGCASQLPGPGREVDDRTPSAPSMMEHQTPSVFPGNFRKRKVLGPLCLPFCLPEKYIQAKRAARKKENKHRGIVGRHTTNFSRASRSRTLGADWHSRLVTLPSGRRTSEAMRPNTTPTASEAGSSPRTRRTSPLGVFHFFKVQREEGREK